MKLHELADKLGCTLDGDPEVEIHSIATLETAGPGDLSFLTDNRYAAGVESSQASAILVPMKFAQAGRNLLRSDNPHVAYAQAVQLLSPPWRPQPGIHPTASIDATAVIGARAYVGAYAVIGAHCRIGDDAVIHAHAVLYPDVEAGDRLLVHAHVTIREGTRIGNDVILQPGVVLGGDGFGFARRNDGSYEKIPQVGRVVLEDGVEIQANSCIDRASLDATYIRKGARIDNLTQVAHNCDVGPNVLLCSQVGLAGTTTIQEGAILAGQVGVAGHCTVGKGAIITAQSGTHGDLEGGKMYSGSPAYDHRQWLRTSALLPRLTDIYRTVQDLSKKTSS
jgi:UDP-3-O-[3-hydroxymyristoyl] glucosamine N-acyltransferase